MSASENEFRDDPVNVRIQRGRLKNLLISWAGSHPISFVAVMSFVMMATKMPMVPFVEMSGGADTTENVVMGGVALLVISFLALPIETLLGQALPIGLLRLLGIRRWRWLILGSSLFFGAMHLGVDVGSFFVGFGGGLTLSVCWLACREVSFMRALIGTTAVHTIHNAMAFAIFFLVPA